MKKPLTAAQRKQAERDRKRDAGLVMVQVWVRPRDVPHLRKYIQRINAR